MSDGFLFPVHGQETVAQAAAEREDREKRMAEVADRRVVEVATDEIYKHPGMTDQQLFTALEASGEVHKEGGLWRVGSRQG